MHDEGLKLLEKMEKRCRNMDDETRIRCLTARCNWLSAAQEQCAAVWEKQKEDRTVSRELFLDFCRLAGNAATYQHGNYPLAETLLKAVMEQETEPMLRADAYGVLVDCLSYERKTEEALEYCQEGIRHVRDFPECAEYLVCGLLSRQCQLYYLLGRMDLVAQAAPELEKRMQETGDLMSKYHLAIGLGYHASAVEDHEACLKYDLLSRSIVEQLRGKENSDYHIMDAKVALDLQKLKRYGEAIALYRKALDYMRKGGYGFWIQHNCNNFSTLYLELEQPDKALEYLNEALEYARPMGGSALGDVQRNRARAFGQKGDTAREYACLKEAAPLLEEAYGPGHPKTTAVRQRLAELAPNFEE